MPETPQTFTGWQDPAEEAPRRYAGWSDPKELAGSDNAARSSAGEPPESPAASAPTGEDLRQAAKILARPLWLAAFALAGIAFYCLVQLLILLSLI